MLPPKELIETNPAKVASATISPTVKPLQTKPDKDSNATILPTKEFLGTKSSKDSGVTISTTKETMGTESFKNSGTPPTKELFGTKPTENPSDALPQTRLPRAKEPIETKSPGDCSGTIPPTKEPLGTKSFKDSRVTIPLSKEPLATIPAMIPPTKEPIKTKSAKDYSDTLPIKSKPSESNESRMLSKESVGEKVVDKPTVLPQTPQLADKNYSKEPQQSNKEIVPVDKAIVPNTVTKVLSKDLIPSSFTNKPLNDSSAETCSKKTTDTNFTVEYTSESMKSFNETNTSFTKDQLMKGSLTKAVADIFPKDMVETNSSTKLIESTSIKNVLSISSTQPRELAVSKSLPEHVITQDQIKSTKESNVTKLSRHLPTALNRNNEAPLQNKTTALKSVEKYLPATSVPSASKQKGDLQDRVISNKPNQPDKVLDLSDTTAKTALLLRESTADKDVTKELVLSLNSELTAHIPSKKSDSTNLVSTDDICISKDSIILKSSAKVSALKESEIQLDAATLSKLPSTKSNEEQLRTSSSIGSKSNLIQSVVKHAEELVGELSSKKNTHNLIKLKPIEELLVAKTFMTDSTITTPTTEKSIDSSAKDLTVNPPLVTPESSEGKSHSTVKRSNVEESPIKESCAQISIVSKPSTESTIAKSSAKAYVDITSPPEQVVSADKAIESHPLDGSTSPIKDQPCQLPSDETSQPRKESISSIKWSPTQPPSKNSTNEEPHSKELNDFTEPSDDSISNPDSTPSKTLLISDLSHAIGTRKLKPTISVRSDLSIKKSKMDDELSSEVESGATSVEKMDESTESPVETVQTRRQGKLKKPLTTENEVKPVGASKVEDEPKPTILGLSLDYNPVENIPKLTTRAREHGLSTGSKLKVKKIETLMEVNTNSLEKDVKCQPTETDPLADYDDLIPVTVTKGKKNAPLPPPPPVGKRKRRSAENEADDGGKRARQRGKEVISDDEVVEEQLLTKRKGRGRPPKGETKKAPVSPKLTRGRSKRVSSTDSTDKDIQPPKTEESKPSRGPRGRRKQVIVVRDSSSDGDDIGIDLVCAASSEDSLPVGAKKQSPVKVKPTPRKTRRVLGLEVPVEPEESGASSVSPPMRQSRRIAQIKIKEEAERLQLEEMTLTVMKHEQREKHANKGDKQNEKKKKQKAVSDDYSAEGEEQDEDFASLKKERKKRKKREKKWTQKDFNESKPWQSSSGSSTSQEEEEEEMAEHSEEDERQITTVLKSDHEFSPESDLEDDALDARPTRLARTAQKVDTGIEDVMDDAACQKCKASDHPEWILLCDKCDTGWHASCLRPALFVIPEGDWYCPPCQHTSLVVRLHEQLREVDRTAKRRDNEELRKKRLAYVGISLDNVLTKDSKEDVVGIQEESGRESGQVEGSSVSSGSGSESGEESEPIYQLRERRAAVFSYRYNEYDDLINSAIQDELEAVNGAGNQGRGKDISTIVNAEKEESDMQKTEEVEEGKEKDVEKEDEAESDVEDEEEEEDGYIPPVKKLVIKKKHRKLNSLDISSEDDPESDEDFKGSSSEGEEEDYDEDADSDDSEMKGRRGRGSSGPVRRSARARTTRFDREFIDDNSDGSDTPRSRSKKKKKKSRTWDETSESEESDSTWGQAPKRPKQASRTHAPKSSESKKKKSKKKKKRVAEGSDIETYKASKPKKPRVKFGGLDESEDVYTARRTRGCKINYVEMGGTDSEEEKFFKSSRTKKLESEEEDEYVANEEEEEEMMDMEDEGKGTENESAEDEQIPEPESVPEPELTPEPEVESEEAPSSEPVQLEVDTKVSKRGKANKGKGKTGVKKSKKVKKVEPLIIATTAIAEESEEELEDLSLLEDQQVQEPVINEAELVKEQKRLKKEVKKLEKKEQKKRGKRKKSELEPGEVSSSPVLPSEILPSSEALPTEVVSPVPLASILDSPTKRKGRGRGKAALAKAAASSDMPQSFPTASSPTQGNSVISRMLQSQPITPARTFADAASVMGQKYFGDQLLPPGVRGMPTSPRPPFLPVRGRHPSPYRQPRSPGVPPYSGPRSGRPMYHTSHHPMDPSPSGGGPIAIAAEGTPPKHSHGTPPPPYGRGGPPPIMGRFGPPDIGQAPNGGSPLRHPFPSATQGSPGRSPNFASYHPPPNYHYGAYPMGTEDTLPPPAYQGSSYPETYTSSPLHTSESSNSKPMEEEGSGEFGGLVSYFSSQREDDLDA